MKNIVMFIIDSLNYSHIKQNETLTPFLNSLKSQNVYFENMFSQAPYTEAAVMNIYCGQNVLDDGGYIKRFYNAKKTIFEVMKEKGYCTYYNSFQPQCYASSLRRGIDFLYNNVGYDLGALWSYRLYMYSDLLSKKELNEKDIKILVDIFDDNFTEWLRFAKDLKAESEELNMIQNNSISYDVDNVINLLDKEYECYLNDKIKYIKDVLKKKYHHNLYSISAFNQDNKIKNKDFIKQIQKKYYSFFEELNSKNQLLNKKNCKGVLIGPKNKLGLFIMHPSLKTLKEFGKSLLLAKNVYKDADLFDRIADNYETFKNAPSVKTHIDHYIRWELNRKKDKPSFSCIHVDDVHNPEVFFTYDSENMALIDSEFADAQDVINNIPNDYFGNITHDLSLRYIDTKIKYFYEQLEKNNLLDNTIVLICADHGFSFSGNPLRDSFVINMYLENYNIPCIITGTDYRGKIDKLCSSKDIPVMLSYLADGNIPKEFTGKNVLLDTENYDNVFIEYCGGGCPDLKRRDLKIGCFNKEWFVASESKLSDLITKDNVTEIYNLKNDPLQFHNLKKKRYNVEVVDELINAINIRKEEIKSSLTEEFQ